MCKGTNKAGNQCGIKTKSDYCHLHKNQKKASPKRVSPKRVSPSKRVSPKNSSVPSEKLDTPAQTKKFLRGALKVLPTHIHYPDQYNERGFRIKSITVATFDNVHSEMDIDKILARGRPLQTDPYVQQFQQYHKMPGEWQDKDSDIIVQAKYSKSGRADPREEQKRANKYDDVTVNTKTMLDRLDIRKNMATAVWLETAVSSSMRDPYSNLSGSKFKYQKYDDGGYIRDDNGRKLKMYSEDVDALPIYFEPVKTTADPDDFLNDMSEAGIGNYVMIMRT